MEFILIRCVSNFVWIVIHVVDCDCVSWVQALNFLVSDFDGLHLLTL